MKMSIARRCLDATRRFLRARGGVTAIEAALVMPAFLFMAFGIVEVALLYFVAATLEGQVGQASRQIRTGNVQATTDPEQAYRDLLCGNLGGLVTCSDVIIDVRRYSSFGAITYPPYFDDDGEEQGAQFTPGAPGDIVVVRTAYRWRILTPFLAEFLGDGGGPTKLLSATSVFRNEPFQGPLN
jgi:Flp pilus assembly protein TadG